MNLFKKAILIGIPKANIIFIKVSNLGSLLLFSNSEVVIIPDNLCHPNNMSLYIKCLNIPKIEQQYSNNRKLKQLVNF